VDSSVIIEVTEKVTTVLSIKARSPSTWNMRSIDSINIASFPTGGRKGTLLILLSFYAFVRIHQELCDDKDQWLLSEVEPFW
jgi:hypothetical protein